MHRPPADPRLAGYTLEPLAGGWSGETFLAVPDGSPGAGERLVVRYFADARHAVAAAGIQAALIRRVGDLVPVPVVCRAREHLRAIARTGDLHAAP